MVLVQTGHIAQVNVTVPTPFFSTSTVPAFTTMKVVTFTTRQFQTNLVSKWGIGTSLAKISNASPVGGVTVRHLTLTWCPRPPYGSRPILIQSIDPRIPPK